MTPLAQDGLAAFGTDPWWLIVGKIIAVFLFLNLMTVFTINYERKVVGRMQHRPGPNRNGPNGWLQSLADGLKLVFKEEIIPRTADKVVYFIAPAISAIAAFVGFAVIPFGPAVNVFGHSTPLQVTDMPVAVLVILATSAMGVYGVVLAGWSSGSTYPLLGGLRSAAQMISYEVAMGLSLVAVFMTAGTISTSEIVTAQAHGQRYDVFGVTVTAPSWYALVLLPSFLIFAIAVVGETNRAPFDLPEAESELVGGFQTEYSSIKFMMFYLAEYIAMITMSALAITLFLGGWMAPWPISLIPGVNSGWWPVLWFVGKLLVLLFVFVWLRGTLPRLRYDQFMHFGWKVLVPVNLVWILVVAGVKVLADDRSQPAWLLAGSAVAALALLVLLWPKRRPVEVPVTEIDTGAGGFPIPPLDLVVPPSPRAQRLTAERATAGSLRVGGDSTAGSVRVGGDSTVAGKEG